MVHLLAFASPTMHRSQGSALLPTHIQEVGYAFPMDILNSRRCVVADKVVMGQDDIVVMTSYDCACSRRAKGPYVSGGPTADDAVLEELRTVVVKGAIMLLDVLA